MKTIYTILSIAGVFFLTNLAFAAAPPPSEKPSCEFCQMYPSSNFCGDVLKHCSNTGGRAAIGSVLNCSITQLKGSFSSYLPPKVGDVIQIDTRLYAIQDFYFRSGNHIPSIEPLMRQPGPTINYRADYSVPYGNTIITILQIVQLQNHYFQARIQQFARGNQSNQWITSTAQLICK